jgi:hypothetical protein
MSARVRRSLGRVGSYVIVSVVLAVLSGLEATGGADPKPGAATVADLLAKFADAVDNGDGAAVRACFDTSKPGGRDYPDYLVAIATMNAGRVAVRHKADTYGPAVRAKAEPLLERQWGAATTSYGPELKGGTDLKEGSRIYPPGFKGQMVIVKKRGVFLIDGSEVLEGVDAEYLKSEKARYVKFGGDLTKIAASAASAEDLLAQLTKLAKE